MIAARLAARVGLAVAPAAVQGWAADRFLAPRRRATAEPSADGIRRVRGAVRTGGEDVVLWSFGEGPVVLLVHGWEGHAGQFSAFVPPLVEAGFRAVAVDLPAHGAATGASTSMVGFARAIEDVARVVGPIAGIIGHSLGGGATLLAALEAERPLAESAALIAPATDPEFFARRAADFMGIPPGHRPGVYARIADRVGRSLDSVDVSIRTGGLDLPLLVLHDPEDREVPATQGQLAAAVSRQGTFEPWAGLGHRRILRDPAAIARAVAFVTQRRARGALAPTGSTGRSAGGAGTARPTPRTPAPGAGPRAI